MNYDEPKKPDKRLMFDFIQKHLPIGREDEIKWENSRKNIAWASGEAKRLSAKKRKF